VTDNPALAALHDVVAPLPVSYAPQTVGWAVLAAALVALLAWLGWTAWQRARANRYRKLALAEIDQVATALQSDPSGARAALETVNEILKRTALTAWPRGEVASLAGDDWLQFLDGTADGQHFRAGPGRALADQVYGPGETWTDEAEGRAFFDVARGWVLRHRRSDDALQTAGPNEPTRGVGDEATP